MHGSINYLDINVLFSLSLFYYFAQVNWSCAKVTTSSQDGRDYEETLETRLLRSLELTSGLVTKRQQIFCRTRERLTFLGQPSCRACAQEDLLNARSTSWLAKKSRSFASAAQKKSEFRVQSLPSSVSGLFDETGTNKPNRENFVLRLVFAMVQSVA